MTASDSPNHKVKPRNSRTVPENSCALSFSASFMEKRINVKSGRHAVMREIATWTGAVFRLHHIRAHMKCVVDASDGKWKRAAAVRERDAQFRKPLEHASKNHGTNRERRFCRHGDKPRQPVFWHALAAQHVPRMNKNRGIELLSSAPDRLKRCVIEVQSIYAPEMQIRIHVRSDLRAAQPELPDAAFQVGRREIRILHWNSSKTGETRRMIANHFGYV